MKKKEAKGSLSSKGTEKPVTGDSSWDYGNVLSSGAKKSPKLVKKDKDSKKRKKKSFSINKDKKSEYKNEEKVRELEKRNVDNEWMSNPNSVLDFERLIMTNGNSSAVWIGYMAFHLNVGDTEMARKTVRRGLARIDFREMTEKQNLWLAYLNMECMYGEDIMSVFNEAVQYNDAKTMYKKAIGIFISNKKLEEAKEVCLKGIKKFGKSKKIWLLYITLLYQHIGDAEEGRQAHKMCINRIPKHKRIFVSSATALLEYKFGSPEIGKRYFEDILLDNPKRTDVWVQYICAHIKLHIEDDSKQKSERLKTIRNLFDRIITLDLKPKKMKIIFSKWLEFECNHGNEKSKEMVQRKALAYVEYIEKNFAG
ncbi:hypothetical protein BEWA_032170 [Theileria equi strain WA]|uniref:Pre-mRNA-splicing factor Syf1/CRNKL1-like C-terminal HAT-repeats domain-containing protein n=1 Tax=Theileria equi strain WA TaxID=1537102 RepID=L0AZQ0_THEEQ|nr:hypothetical protein BEWA_032170 [Theileria equi strain WA]AFZ80364.1 hypothetical protein BEWA_032170 [Theileria equi strain WA]|eukprot:XP_004830030.1 hypothetical protein BEWA_032170 [Theileria equi strain WA]